MGASRLRVFGPVARGEKAPDSEVDFLAEFACGYDLFTPRMPLAQALGDLLHRKLDLMPEHGLNPRIRAQVLAEAVPI